MQQTCALFRRRFIVPLGLLVALLGLAAACGDSPSSPSAVAGANLSVRLTDAPIDDVDEVNIFFTSVTAKPEQGSVQRLTLALPQNPVNLLALTNRTVDFAAAVLDPGRYEFMQINIDEGRSYLVEKGVRKSLRVPSGEVKVLGGFTIDNDHKTTITLDFDAEDSLNKLGNGDWLLRPVIVMTGHNVSSRN